MAAPSGIVWGSEVNSRYKLGIYTAVSSTNTQTTVTIQVWLWSKYTLSDSTNEYYFNNNATSATTLFKSNISLSHTTNSSWSTDNQTQLATHTYTYDRNTSAKTINCAAKLAKIGSSSDTVTATVSYTIPVLASYTVSYVANAGSENVTNLPSKQVKYYGKAITLSSAKPTRTGYTFLGWSTSTTATTATYAAGASFTANANTNLYAVWKANTYAVKYNANGGTGAPSDQTKTYGKTLTLSTTKPTRTNYSFKGWGTSANATTVAYASGASYTANAAVTLYAIWEVAYTKPRITSVSINRCDSGGTISDNGTYFKASFSWSTYLDVTSVVVYWKKSTASSWSSKSLTASGKSGSHNAICGSNDIELESSYDVKITVTDSNGNTSVTGTVPGQAYLIDFLSGGGGVSILKPAEKKGFDIGSDTYVRGVQVTGNTLVNKGTNTINNTTDDTVENWVAQGNNSVHYYNTMGQLIDQPNQYGILVNFTGGTGINVHQLWLTQSSGSIYHRSGNANGWGQSWKELIDTDGGTIKGAIHVSSNSSASFSVNNDQSGSSKNTVIQLRTANEYKWGTCCGSDGNFFIWDNVGSKTPISIIPSGGAITLSNYTILNNTINAIGYYRLHTEWIGFYASSANAQNNASRKGWIGFNATNNFNINNGSSGSNITNVAWTVSSDERLKMDIEDVPDTFVDIWRELQPKIFKWNDKNSTNDKYHFGLIAQDVVAAFEKYDLDYTEYGFVNSFTLPEDDTEYFGIAYDEYHMLTSMTVKKQQERIDSLEKRIERLEQLILGQEE